MIIRKGQHAQQEKLQDATVAPAGPWIGYVCPGCHETLHSGHHARACPFTASR
jgi:hypothetical protein